MTAALRRVFALPSGLSGEDIEGVLADHMDLVYSLVTMIVRRVGRDAGSD